MDKEYTKLLRDMGLNSGDISQVKKMLKKFESNSGGRAISEQDVKNAAKKYLKRKGNPHEDNKGQLINKYPKMGNPYNKGGHIKTYAKGGGVRKPKMTAGY
jgi:hypothetical protein